MKPVARMTQGRRRLHFPNDMHASPALLKLAAQADKIRVARHDHELVGAPVEQHLECVQRQRDIGRVLPAHILELQARRKAVADQRFLPLVGQRSRIAITAPQNHTPEG